MVSFSLQAHFDHLPTKSDMPKGLGHYCMKEGRLSTGFSVEMMRTEEEHKMNLMNLLGTLTGPQDG